MVTLESLAGEHQAIALAIVFLFGLLWGSFANVVIYRLPEEESVVFPRSRCPKCRTLIRWYQNIPVLSWLALRGKCAACGTRISPRYPFVELLMGFAFWAVAWHDSSLIAWPFHFFFVGSLIVSTFIDLDHWILPDKITYPGMLVGLASSFLLPDFSVLESFTGLFLGGGILYAVAAAYQAISHKDGLGGGDIKFLAMVGAFLGPKGAIATLVLSSTLGSILGIFLIVLRGKSRSSAVQFGPFLAAGAAVAFFFGEPLWQWYFNIH